MNLLSASLFVIALILAVVLGPQTRPWTWGPSLIPLALAVAAALPGLWKTRLRGTDVCLLILGIITAGWFAFRASISPVKEFAISDALLLGSAVGSFLVMRAIAESERATKIFTWGLASLLLASVGVIIRQLFDANYVPVFHSRPASFPSGFFGHYNEGANFLIGASFLLAGSAFFGAGHRLSRWLWALISLAGLVSVYFTRSRGAILAVAVGVAVFFVLALMIGKRKGAKWFAPLIIAIPVVGILVIGFLYQGWSSSQEVRLQQPGLETLMDNSIRLHLLGIAFSCITLHPLLGGGSRSFEWECFSFWDIKQHGLGGPQPKMAHNELIQAFTDYGIIGGALLIFLLGFIAVFAVSKILFPDRKDRIPPDALYIGGLAGLAGMFVQSSFSFVFHLLPGAILLGICLGRASVSLFPKGHATLQSGYSWARACCVGAGFFTAIFLLPWGWKGSRLMVELWPTFFGERSESPGESHIDALSAAINVWPQSTLYKERAIQWHRLSTAEAGTPASLESSNAAINDFLQALLLHPYDGIASINLANLLSSKGRNEEAESQYLRTIELQGGMEHGLEGNYYFSQHLLKVGSEYLKKAEFEKAETALTQAANHIDKAVIGEARPLKISIFETLGIAREAAGKRTKALEAYDTAASIPGGEKMHFRSANILSHMAASTWSNREPSEALFLFKLAKVRLNSSNSLPSGISITDKQKLLAYLDKNIEFLTGARVEPIDPNKK
jgi:O-antigen ligase